MTLASVFFNSQLQVIVVSVEIPLPSCLTDHSLPENYINVPVVTSEINDLALPQER